MSIFMLMSSAAALNTAQIKDANFDDLLDLNLEDSFEELPEFCTPAPGYGSFEIKEVAQTEGNKDEGLQAIRVIVAIKGYEEIGNPKLIENGTCTDEPGRIFSLRYQQGAGLQLLVQDFKGVAQALGDKSLRELMQRMAGNTINAEVTLRSGTKREDGTTPFYPSLKNVTIAEIASAE